MMSWPEWLGRGLQPLFYAGSNPVGISMMILSDGLEVPGCICSRNPNWYTEKEDGSYVFDLDPECGYHGVAAEHPDDHRIPWNCPTYWDGCNCEVENDS